MRYFYVYIMTNYSNTVLYVGVTNDLERRIFEHKTKVNKGFAEKYNVYKLVYAEEYTSHSDAIGREKQLKHWSREKKENLINSMNPEWKDLLAEETKPTCGGSPGFLD